MPFISFSIKFEDILLLRALNDIQSDVGFYIDVGANDPENDSVTKLFYDHGWYGLNIEASPYWFARIVERRPRDINIHAAASDKVGPITLYDHTTGGLGTSVEQFADRHEALYGIAKRAVEVEAITLTEVCEKHAPQEIHFLKIDVEGHEANVIRGMNFSRFRPWILCIEATEPLRVDVLTHHEWEPIILAADYIFAQFDGLNRWYVAAEHPERLAAFKFLVDDYIHYHHLRRISELEDQLRLFDAQRISRITYSAARAYPASLFFARGYGDQPTGLKTEGRSTPWVLNIDLDSIESCLVWGPYVSLNEGEYEVEYSFDISWFDAQQLELEIIFDVAQNMARLTHLTLSGESGAALLNSRSVKLKFINSIPNSVFEFRILTGKVASKGELQFRGAVLRHVDKSS